jgi:hypothetical protein
MRLFSKAPIDTRTDAEKKVAELLARDAHEAAAESRALADLDTAVRNLDAFETLNAVRLRRRGFRDDLAGLGHPLPPPYPTGLSVEALAVLMRCAVPICVESGVPITARTLLTFR